GRARGGANARQRAHPRGRVPPDAERLRLRRLPRARPRVRGAAASRAVGIARGCRLVPSYVREARGKVGPKRLRIKPVIERLAVEHADATIALTFASDLELLVSVMLSAQTTDVNVNRVTSTLFQ